MVFIGCISPMLMASDSLEGSVSYGFDSNPYKLSSPDGLQRNREYKALQFEYQGDSLVGDLEGSLVGNQLKSSRKKANLLYRLKLNKRVYNASSSAADSSRVDGHLRWIERFKLGERKASLLLSGDIRSERNTYYSQTQRQIAETSDGELIDNRFSFDAASLSAELVYYADKKHSWSLLTQFGQRNYRQDYEDVGLESIDFNEFRLQPNFRYKTESGSDLRLFVYHRSRDYRSLRNNLESDVSLVEYSLNGYGAVFGKALSDNLDSSFYLSGYFARDNGIGVRDLDFHKLSVTLDYRLGSDANIEIIGEAYRREYLNQQSVPEESEAGSSGSRRDGLVIGFTYTKVLAFESLLGVISLRRETEHNSSRELGYHRQLVSVGLRLQL